MADLAERPASAPHDDLRFLPPAQTWKVLRAALTGTWQQAMRMRVYGADRLPREAPAVLACNHQSNVDSFAIGLAAYPRNIRYLAKTELFEAPVIGRFLPHLGAIAVRRGESDRDAIRQARRVIAANCILGIFVEGTRQQEVIGEVQPGAAMLAIASGAPIIVCCISGSRRHAKDPRHPVSVSFSTPLDLSSFGRGSKAYRAASLVLKANLERQSAFLRATDAAGRPRRATPPEGFSDLSDLSDVKADVDA